MNERKRYIVDSKSDIITRLVNYFSRFHNRESFHVISPLLLSKYFIFALNFNISIKSIVPDEQSAFNPILVINLKNMYFTLYLFNSIIKCTYKLQYTYLLFAINISSSIIIFLIYLFKFLLKLNITDYFFSV